MVTPDVVGVMTSVGIRCGKIIGLKPLSFIDVVNCACKPSCNDDDTALFDEMADDVVACIK